jgi:hypothetical protein
MLVNSRGRTLPGYSPHKAGLSLPIFERRNSIDLRHFAKGDQRAPIWVDQNSTVGEVVRLGLCICAEILRVSGSGHLSPQMDSNL